MRLPVIPPGLANSLKKNPKTVQCIDWVCQCMAFFNDLFKPVSVAGLELADGVVQVLAQQGELFAVLMSLLGGGGGSLAFLPDS